MKAKNLLSPNAKI